MVHMKVLLMGFDNQCVTLGRNTKNIFFIAPTMPNFVSKRTFAGNITFLLSPQEIFGRKLSFTNGGLWEICAKKKPTIPYKT